MFGCALQERKLVQIPRTKIHAQISSAFQSIASTAYLSRSIIRAAFATVLWIIRTLALSPDLPSDNCCYARIKTRDECCLPRVCNLRKILAVRRALHTEIKVSSRSNLRISAGIPQDYASVGWHYYIIFERASYAHVTSISTPLSSYRISSNMNAT